MTEKDLTMADEMPQSSCVFDCPGCWEFAHQRAGCTTFTVHRDATGITEVVCHDHNVAWSGGLTKAKVTDQ